MTYNSSEHDFFNQNTPFGNEPELSDENVLRDEINRALGILACSFKSGKNYYEVDDLKNHRNAVYAIIGPDIAKSQYPNHSNTQSVRRLMLLMAPLNNLAKKWRKPYVLKNNPEHYSLGDGDFHDDKSHDNCIALDKFNNYIFLHGNFMELSQATAYAVERIAIEILRIKPRVEYDFDNPEVTYLTGLSDTCLYLDSIIDPILSKHQELIHAATDDKSTMAFFKHACKNAGLHVYINSGIYHIRECQELKITASSFLKWKKQYMFTTIPPSGEEERQIAKCIAAIHALDRSAGGDVHQQIRLNMNPKYLGRVSDFVHYLRHAKDEKNQPLSLKLIRRGDTNKRQALYPELKVLAKKIYHQDVDKLVSEATRVIHKREIHDELRKFVSNIFSLMTCWEHSESILEKHMIDYCTSREKSWTYRTDLIRKLLRLDYEQLQHFHQEIVGVLDNESTLLESKLNAKLYY